MTSRPKGGYVKAQCAPLLLFLRAVAVEGSAIQFATSDRKVVAPDKALEAQRMEILRRDLPAHFDKGASGGLSPGDAKALALTAFEVRTDMLERTCVVSDGAPRALRVKTPEEIWGAVLEGALHIHGCVDASSLPPVYAALAVTPKWGERITLQGLYQTRANAQGAAMTIPPVLIPAVVLLFPRCGLSNVSSPLKP